MSIIRWQYGPLTSSEKQVWARGQNFYVTPIKLPVHKIVTQMESGLTRAKVDNDQHGAARASIAAILTSSKPPKPNITRDERQALQDLRKGEKITILPTDKGRFTVMTDKSDYDEKIMAHLWDEMTYERLRKKPTAVVGTKKARFLRTLREEGVLSKQDYYEVCTSSEADCEHLWGADQQTGKVPRPDIETPRRKDNLVYTE